MTTAAEMLAGECVSQLVQNLNRGEHNRQSGDVLDRQQRVESWHVGWQRIDPQQNQKSSGPAQKPDDHEKESREKRPDPGIKPVEKRIGIEAAKADGQHVRHPLQQLATSPAIAPLKHRRALADGLGQQKPCPMHLSQETVQVIAAQLPGSESLIEVFLNFGNRGRAAVEQFENGIFALAKMKILKRDRIFDNPIRLTPVPLLGDYQIGTHPHP